MSYYDENLIMEYLDGELSAEQTKNFQKHLQSCPDCQILLQEYKEFYRGLEHLPVLEPERDFTVKLINRLPELDLQKQSRLKNLLYAAAVLLILGIAALPYLPAMQNMGPAWDSIKIYLGVVSNITNIIGIFFKTFLIVSGNLIRGLGVLTNLLTANQTLVVIISLLILIVQALFIKFFILNPEWRN